MEDLKKRLTDFYNKFNEDKRLDSRHGQVEFLTSVRYISECLRPGDRIVDIGAGPGRYSLYFRNEGYDVTAVEYVRPNIGKLRARDKDIRIVEATATDLSMFHDCEFDIAILFGPMYHLPSNEERLKALLEAKRITKRRIFAAYLMNEYAVIEHAFKDDNYRGIKDKIREDWKIDDPDALFFHARIEDMDELNERSGLRSVLRFSQEGPSDYMRNAINRMDDETFFAFIDFHLKTCERKDLLGASSHVVDILEKTED